MKISMALIFFSFLQLVHMDGQQLFDVEGAIKIQNTTSATPEPGTIRFNDESSEFEGWNGHFWVSFSQGLEVGSVTDQDGNTYRTVVIDCKEWMAENLRTKKYLNGDPIPSIGNDANWAALTTGARTYFNRDNSLDVPYGLLYNWFAVNDNRGLCPSGWSVPSKQNYIDLANFLGGDEIAGAKLKERYTTHWMSPNEGGTNITGFTALPGSFRNSTGGDADVFGVQGRWWTRSQSHNASEAWMVYMQYDKKNLYVDYDEPHPDGNSIRCIKNN